MTVRATARGAERTSLDGTRADVVVCGASFAGLAVARELALGTRGPADVLVLDRYEIGERATSACAAPTPWLHAMGVGDAILQELPRMTFSTPHGRAAYRLPWSWSSFDYRTLCRLLWEQCGSARFETAVVHGRDGDVVHTDRGDVIAPLVVDACGWRRISARPHVQPPEAPLSRGLEVHPGDPRDADGDALDIWLERSLVRRGYGWNVPAGDHRRVGTCSYDPVRPVKGATQALAARLDVGAVGYQGNWFPHRLGEATQDGAFCVGDSAGHCFPLSGEGIRTAFYFGIACGRELAPVLDGDRTRAQALDGYRAFHERHRPAFARALALQRLIPALPPRVLSLLLRAVGVPFVVDRAFGWYLDQAHPSAARRPTAPAQTPAVHGPAPRAPFAHRP
ncbi:NAD(P)/FAD-dependent oxidoreductase [Baekduia soli]|uniref:NAD(P)/FAD-dependent oxidoreductase n=1 Tax=Baekduia soli TaxID=496014 RepID=A0A5B8U909_9ACTN|nr:NAD(P)/FAD-dependent oxidoreductase [Baekduia soli]QEC49626.1 NAD(P)/FAD-dependent oxidoreductase [Baekduia soli]